MQNPKMWFVIRMVTSTEIYDTTTYKHNIHMEYSMDFYMLPGHQTSCFCYTPTQCCIALLVTLVEEDPRTTSTQQLKLKTSPNESSCPNQDLNTQSKELWRYESMTLTAQPLVPCGLTCKTNSKWRYSSSSNFDSQIIFFYRHDATNSFNTRFTW